MEKCKKCGETYYSSHYCKKSSNDDIFDTTINIGIGIEISSMFDSNSSDNSSSSSSFDGFDGGSFGGGGSSDNF